MKGLGAGGWGLGASKHVIGCLRFSFFWFTSIWRQFGVELYWKSTPNRSWINRKPKIDVKIGAKSAPNRRQIDAKSTPNRRNPKIANTLIFHEKYSDSCPSTEYRSILRRRNIIDGISMVIVTYVFRLPRGRSKHVVGSRNIGYQWSNVLIYQGKILCLNGIPSSYDRWMYIILCKALRT